MKVAVRSIRVFAMRRLYGNFGCNHALPPMICTTHYPEFLRKELRSPGLSDSYRLVRSFLMNARTVS